MKNECKGINKKPLVQLLQRLQCVHLKSCQPELVEGGLSEESCRLRQAQPDISLVRKLLFYFHTKQALLFNKAFQHITGYALAHA
jgi:hypothetical protein